MRFTPLAVAARRHTLAGATPALLALLLASGPALRAQRPLKDQDILQYLNQTITWYRDVAAVVQSPAGSREAVVRRRPAPKFHAGASAGLRLCACAGRHSAGESLRRTRCPRTLEAATWRRPQPPWSNGRSRPSWRSSSSTANCKAPPRAHAPGLLVLRDEVTSERTSPERVGTRCAH